MDTSSERPEQQPVKCGACGEPEQPGSPHRRGRCRRCYAAWVRERPVGLGAFCCACGERRKDALRHLEMGETWVVLCHGCAARAERLAPQPRTVSGLKLRLQRERRWGDRRAESVGAPRKTRVAGERRADDRRLGERGVVDVTDLAEMEMELVAEPGTSAEDDDPTDGPITGVHRLIEPTEV